MPKREMCNLGSYVLEAGRLAYEIETGLSADDMAWVETWYRTDGVGGIYSWIFDNLNLLCQYIALPESRRAAKKWREPLDQARRIRYGSAVLCRLAKDLLSGIDNLPLEGGVPYRTMAATAGKQAFLTFSRQYNHLWPFVDTGKPEEGDQS